MTTNDTQTSGGVQRPAPISATPSVDNLQVASESSAIDMGSRPDKGTLPPESSASMIQNQQAQQQQITENSCVVPIAPTSHGSVISPSYKTNSAAGELGIPALVLPPPEPPVKEAQPIGAAGTVVLSGLVAGSQAPEFLYQLTKMLTDDNRETIEWCHGMIEVHSPKRLESEVLHKYFRHSKFASFQRQLNYFGFRKQAGKGKMAPCSYVNEDLPSTDLGCLLHIKRKTSLSTSAKEKEKQGKKKDTKLPSGHQSVQGASSVNPVLAGILQRSSLAQTTTSVQASTLVAAPESTGDEQHPATTAMASHPATTAMASHPATTAMASHPATTAMASRPATTAMASRPAKTATASHQAVAQAAVGRGIRHGYGRGLLHPSQPTFANPATINASVSTTQDACSFSSESFGHATDGLPHGVPSNPSFGTFINNPLSQLATNYQNSLNDVVSEDALNQNANTSASSEVNHQMPFPGGFLKRDDSLVDLAMIPVVESSDKHEEMTLKQDCGTEDVGLSFIDFPDQDVFPLGPKPTDSEADTS